MRQRARETGALPSGLVRAGEVFDWPTLEPWAEPVDAAEQVTAQQPKETPVAAASGARVVPGKSETSPPPDRSRRAKNRTAET